MISIFQNKQTQLAESLAEMMAGTYYNYWHINENEAPILDSAIFITYRNRRRLGPGDTMMNSFYRMTRELIQVMSIQYGSRKVVHQRQPVGMYAMDYGNSRDGRWVPENHDPHIHSVWIINPEIRELVEDRLEELVSNYNGRFFWKPADRNHDSIKNAIHYCLKGIMQEQGFYPGRGDQYDVIGPRIPDKEIALEPVRPFQKFQKKPIKLVRDPEVPAARLPFI